MKTIKTNKAKTNIPKMTAKAAPAAGLDAPPATKRTAKVAAVTRPEARATAVPTTAAPTTATPAVPGRKITTDLIAARAYIIWEKQGRPHGQEVANWLLAESQLREEIHSFTA
ncbi:MAG: DUF2934 domain-containing protein [Verrucomicrobiota bacterium]|jgi:hypothetical protein